MGDWIERESGPEQFIWQNKDEKEKHEDKQTEVSAKVVRSIKGQDQFKKEER